MKYLKALGHDEHSIVWNGKEVAMFLKFDDAGEAYVWDGLWVDEHLWFDASERKLLQKELKDALLLDKDFRSLVK